MKKLLHIHTMEYYSAIRKNKPLIYTTMGFPCGPDGNPPVMQQTRVWFLGQEDPLEKG